MKLFGGERKKAFSAVKKGRERKAGIVVGTSRNRWLLDTDSRNFAAKGEGVFDSVISMTLAYLAKAPAARGTLLFEDCDGKLLAKIMPLLNGGGYTILQLNSIEAYGEMESLYPLLICKPTAIFVDEHKLMHFMNCLLWHVITKNEGCELPIPMTVFLSKETVMSDDVCFAMAQRRNITFVMDLKKEDLRWRATAPYEVLIQGNLTADSNEAVIFKHGFPPAETHTNFFNHKNNFVPI